MLAQDLSKERPEIDALLGLQIVLVPMDTVKRGGRDNQMAEEKENGSKAITCRSIQQQLHRVVQDS